MQIREPSSCDANGVSLNRGECQREKTDTPRNVSKSFLFGVMMLSLSTILVKIIGLIYKIPMLRYLGSVGMGYFNAAYEWFALLSVIAGAGLPVAMSMMIAAARSTHADGHSRRRTVRRIERIAFRVFLVFGIFGTALLFFGANIISQMIGSPQTAPSIRAVAPTVLFSCLGASYRGYFQGHQNMKPTAISQLIESLGKLILGLLFARLAMQAGKQPPLVSAFAMLGLSLGVMLSTAYLVLCRLFHRDPDTGVSAASATRTQGAVQTKRTVLGQLLSVAIPITLGSAVLSLTRLVDMTMILRRLQAVGFSDTQANAQYGIYTTMAIPVFNLIPALLTSISLSLIPSLSAHIAQKDLQAQQQDVDTSLKLTALLSLPASFALSVYSQPILKLLFRANTEELALAAPLLSVLGASVVFSGLITTTNAILQSYSHVKIPILSMLIGCLIKLLVAYLLIATPGMHILGAPISSLICNVLIVGINLFAIQRIGFLKIRIANALFTPMIISLLSVGLPAAVAAILTARGVSDVICFLLAIPVTLLIHLVLTVKLDLLHFSTFGSQVGCWKINRFLNRIPRVKRLCTHRIKN